MNQFYLDTSIWLDLFETRGRNGKRALKLIKKIIDENFIILYSDLHIKELKYLGYSFDEVRRMFAPVKNNLRRVHINKKQINLSKKISLQRNIPKGDVLHAILSRDNYAQLISRDRHFQKLKDITIPKKPEEVTQSF